MEEKVKESRVRNPPDVIRLREASVSGVPWGSRPGSDGRRSLMRSEILRCTS